MRRNHAFGVAILAALIMAGAGFTAAALDQATPIAPAPAAPEVDGACSAGDPLRADCCASRCNRDRDCDRICGKRNGVCVRVNSCCNECACLS